jgi:hypothetical protein
VIQRQYVTVTKLPGTADHRWHGVVNRYVCSAESICSIWGRDG